MKRHFVYFIASIAVALSVWAVSSVPRSLAAVFSPGNLVIYRVGDGSAALTNAATPVFLDEYSLSGTLVQSIPMPVTVNGSQRRLTANGTATSEGLITLSENRQYLTLTGFDAAVGLPGVASTNIITTGRVIGRAGVDGLVDTSTVISNAFSTASIRSAATDDGTRFWAAGGATGIAYITFGTQGASTIIANSPFNLRQLKIGHGQLYVGSSTSTFNLSTVGIGKPTTAGQTITNLPGLPTAGLNPHSFYFADLDNTTADYDTLYLTQDGTSGGFGNIRFDGSWLPIPRRSI